MIYTILTILELEANTQPAPRAEPGEPQVLHQGLEPMTAKVTLGVVTGPIPISSDHGADDNMAVWQPYLSKTSPYMHLLFA
jgi:hypothetical protein